MDYWRSFEGRRERAAKYSMRLAYFFGGLTAGIFTLFRIPRLPEAFNDVLGGSDYKRFVATTFICLTVLTAALTMVCVKKTFPPPRSK